VRTAGTGPWNQLHPARDLQDASRMTFHYRVPDPYYARRLRVVIIKPSKYGSSGYVERFRRGFMPNSTVPYMRSMTPASIQGVKIETHPIDEYVQTDLSYLDLLRRPEQPTLLALVGVQSHQFRRSLDLAAFARAHGVRHCVIGGPHPMTCDT